MENKNVFEMPVATIVIFESEDVITTSGEGGGLGDVGGWDPQLEK